MRLKATEGAGRGIFYNHPCHDTAQGIIYMLKDSSGVGVDFDKSSIFINLVWYTNMGL